MNAQWKVTHLDQRLRRRQQVFDCTARAAAEALAEAMFGPARYLAAVRLSLHAKREGARP